MQLHKNTTFSGVTEIYKKLQNIFNRMSCGNLHNKKNNIIKYTYKYLKKYCRYYTYFYDRVINKRELYEQVILETVSTASVIPSIISTHSSVQNIKVYTINITERNRDFYDFIVDKKHQVLLYIIYLLTKINNFLIKTL